MKQNILHIFSPLIRILVVCTLFPFLFFLGGCNLNKYPKESDLALQIKEMGQMATVEYEVNKIIKASHEADWYKWGERKIIISAHATIKAGVDFKKLNEEDVRIQGNSIEIQLPYPEILTFNMSPDGLKTEYVIVSGLRDKFSSEEVNALLREAEKEIRGQIPQMGILETAKENTSLFFQVWLKQMGFEQVWVHYKEDKNSLKDFSVE